MQNVLQNRYTMKEIILNVVSAILQPIKKFPLEFLILIILFLFPSVYVYTDSWLGRIKYMILCMSMRLSSQFLFIVALSYICTYLLFLSYKYSKNTHIVLRNLFILVLIFINICQMFLFDNFGMEINTFAFQLLNETNSNESSEFISTYILTIKSIKYVIIAFLPTIALIFSNKINVFLCKAVNNRLKKQRIPLKMGISIYVLLSLCLMAYSIPLFSTNWIDNLKKSGDRGRFGISDCSLFTIYNSMLQFNDEKEELNICSQSQNDIDAKIIGDTIDNIVIVIGESYNRHHSSLYGYDKETNPFLSKTKNLFVFDDVITSINGTAPSFKNFLSTASVDDTKAWYEKPLFLTVFKHVGYNVVFNSNQFVLAYDMDNYSASCGFFFHPKIRPLIFSKSNDRTFEYDEDLISFYEAHRDTMEREHHNLIIHHLFGQHVNPKSRYPERRSHFTFNDYSERTELSEEDKEYVATYDNATRYNDSIVSQIIEMYSEKEALVIYFADHGDEANDYRLHKGRARGLEKLGAPCLHCQLDIPFMIYISDMFARRHPETVSRIKESVHRPFMTDDLSHLLFDIANIETKWYEPTRSLINRKYNDKRKRIITGFSLKGSVDYDEVCDKFGRWSIGF